MAALIAAGRRGRHGSGTEDSQTTPSGNVPYERSPAIPARALPLTEQDDARALDNNFGQLEYFVGRFQSALSLFDHSQELKLGLQVGGELSSRNTSQRLNYSSWAQIAGRDGAMTIWDFAQAMHGVKASLNKCPTVKALVVSDNLEAAIRLFHENFPKAKKMRHAVAHPGEIHSTPANQQSNSISGPFDAHGIKLSDKVEHAMISGLSGRIVHATIYGEMLSYELSGVSLDKLAAVKSAVFAVFRDASITLMDRYYRALQKPPSDSF